MERARIDLAIPVPGLVVLVGAAGSGKSTFARRHFRPDEVASSDDLRERITGDAADQRVSRLVFRIVHREVERRLAAGRLVVVDATNVRAHARAPLRRRAAAAGVPAIAIVFDTPPEVVLARNAGRSRRVPEGIVRRQLAELARTLGTIGREGFDGIVILGPDAVDDVIVRRTPIR